VRVIAGIYRGRRLRAVEGLEVRPTSDRLRETLFNILAPVIEGARFLDLCAGSGLVGIEALSRGASEVTFIDVSRRSSAVIESNLRALRIENEATIIGSDAGAALKRLAEQGKPYDIAFFDPPYASGLYAPVMKLLGTEPLLSPEGLAVVEHRSKSPLESEYGRLRAFREVKQGDSALTFYIVGSGQ
jgi:16S rRNA (guanine966-N2)-methyltransferase